LALIEMNWTVGQRGERTQGEQKPNALRRKRNALVELKHSRGEASLTAKKADQKTEGKEWSNGLYHYLPDTQRKKSALGPVPLSKGGPKSPDGRHAEESTRCGRKSSLQLFLGDIYYRNGKEKGGGIRQTSQKPVIGKSPRLGSEQGKLQATLDDPNQKQIKSFSSSWRLLPSNIYRS